MHSPQAQSSRIYRHLRTALIILFAGLLSYGLAPRSAGAQPDTTRWTPALTMQYDQIAETEISPDGNRVAYVVREAVMDKTTSTFRQHIHVAAVDGSSNVQFTYGEHSNWTPKWSPSGDRLAFLSARGGPPQVHVMRLHGGEPYAITDAETGVNAFQWDPGGERIAYTATDPKSEAERRREREKRDVHLVGEEFRYAHLYTTEVKPAADTTREVQRLTRGDFHVTEFDWAPDGSSLMFSHQPDPRMQSRAESTISSVPADSGALETLVADPGHHGDVRYGPDGQRIAFVSNGGGYKFHTFDVYTVPAGGGEPTRLAYTPGRRATLVGWTAEGASVLVTEDVRTARHVFAVPAGDERAGERQVRQVTAGDGIYGSLSYSRSADQLAFSYEHSTKPEEVYVGRREDFSRRRLTSVNAEVPRPEMGRTELMSWPSTDGAEIEGLLTYPVGYDGGRVPLVLNVHGGPAGAYKRSFSGAPVVYLAPQVFAQKGYAVLRPNPRGSSGYGRDFSLYAIKDWRHAPLEDLMAGVDRAIEMGVAHPDSLAITGWSYGGHMTAFAVTRTDRFEAASMGAGVSNRISLSGTSDLHRLGKLYPGGSFWENYEVYEEQSPIYHVQNVSTPTQVIHGAEDERVPPSQGQEFFRALRRRGVPTEMVLYPRSPHVPREPKQHVDITTRILDWFDEHLGRSSGGHSEP